MCYFFNLGGCHLIIHALEISPAIIASQWSGRKAPVGVQFLETVPSYLFAAKVQRVSLAQGPSWAGRI